MEKVRMGSSFIYFHEGYVIAGRRACAESGVRRDSSRIEA
jgi:hypothetical protein